ncbi:Cystathionine gamma-synthase [Paramyrothecium foliicola]|nr:Cystathionine gamma-synthase [Paramyrothecium foliicola]
MVVPYVDVSHLASASSFYSAVLQPLGLSYLDLEPTGEDQDPPASVTYGFDGEPVLQIRQNPTPLGPLRLSSLVLTAPSRSAVIEFHACGLRANPPLLLPGGQRPWLGFDGGVSRAVVYDLNGNKMEAFYPDDYSAQDSVQYSGSASRRTRSNRPEAGRVFNWNYDISSTRPSTTLSTQSFGPAPDLPPYQHQRQHQRQPETSDHAYAMSRRSEQPAYPLRRSLTHDPASTSRPYNPSLSSRTAPHSSSQRQVAQPEPIQSDSPRQSSLTSGLSTTTVLGALLGVAAGAAVTYGLVSQDRERKPVQEVNAAPLLPRRATFPEKISSDRRSRYDERGSSFSATSHRKPVDDYHARSIANEYPSGKRIEDYSTRRVVYADVAEDCEDVWSPSRYLPPSTRAYEPSIGKPASHARDVDETFDTRSCYSSRHQTGRTAVSVSLPTWQSNVGYEEGEQWVIGRMNTGYPRFFIHKSIQALAQDILSKHGQQGQNAMLFPTPSGAKRCLEYIRSRTSTSDLADAGIIDLVLDTSKQLSPLLKQLSPTVSAVLFPESAFSLAKQYWQHTGDGVSSRRADFCHALVTAGLMVPAVASQSPTNGTPQARTLRGPKRYQRPGSIDGISPAPSKRPSPPVEDPVESRESSLFLEERFGRNLNLSLVEPAKSAIRRRIAGSLTSEINLDDVALHPMATNTRGVVSLREDDVYLFPAGMNAIYNAHRALLAARGPLKSINYGFPYVDTLKILQRFGPGCMFYSHGSSSELDDLEERLKRGERFLALFCEFPGNPLLSCPDLQRIRKLADEYDFALVVDETIGSFVNINVLHVADMVVSSLTKIFSGDCNVMGGSAILNPDGRFYAQLKKAMGEIYEDTYWPEDVIFMERNSRDFIARVDRINVNAEAICDTLRNHPLVKALHYPKYNPSRPCYDACRLPNGGYGGLLSIVFNDPRQSQAFYDAIEIAKGPSLGTNFTLCSPYVLLAHYQEMQWAAECGVDPNLVRVSVGLEETGELRETFEKALKAAEAVSVLQN